MPASWVDIIVNGSTMEGYLTQPEAQGRHPAVVVIQEIWGVNSHIQSVVDRLPARGYVGLAPAMFHREGPMTIGLHEEMDTAIARMGRSTDVNILSDVKAAVDYIKAQSFVQGDKIGIVGFCFGGRVSYLAACSISDLSASVVFYGGGIGTALGGGPSPLEQTSNIGCPVLGLFGEEDTNPTPEDVAKMDEELTKYGKTHEFHSYAGAGHGFHCEARASYMPEAAADGWGKAMAWFDKYLK
ncbi:MAG: dienelactone hydrolase family protein [Chloroflexi bacterium]|nr:dienelactone hydrolase family protein [Chloroflexota bacterium]